MPGAALVVPCYNEERRLDVDAFASFAPAGLDLRFVFVDDGSRDGTLGVLEGLAARLPDAEVLALAKNGGKAEAVRQGMLLARARLEEAGALDHHIGYWDADLATPLAELPRFVEVMDARPEIDLVLGTRAKLLGRDIHRKAFRHYSGRVFATAVSEMLRLPVYDTQCGAKLFRSGVVPEAFASPFLSRWIFDVEVIARLGRRYVARGEDLADRLYELPLRAWRDVDGSKLSAADAVRAARELAAIGWRYRDVVGR
ncbi:MAG: glycosyltransferase [Myxococcota bacterium]